VIECDGCHKEISGPDVGLLRITSEGRMRYCVPCSMDFPEYRAAVEDDRRRGEL